MLIAHRVAVAAVEIAVSLCWLPHFPVTAQKLSRTTMQTHNAIVRRFLNQIEIQLTNADPWLCFSMTNSGKKQATYHTQ